MTQQYDDREAWLTEASRYLCEDLFALPGPIPYRVSCGWPRGSRGGKRAIAQCWPRERSEAGLNEIFISPELSDPATVLSALGHELIHASLNCEGGHTGRFAVAARRAGYVRPFTHAVPGAELIALLSEVAAVLGDYPHATVTPDARRPGSRQRKCQCSTCGLVLRMSRQAIQRVLENERIPNCGDCPAGCGPYLKLDV